MTGIRCRLGFRTSEPKTVLQADIHAGAFMDGRMDGWTDGRMDGWTGRMDGTDGRMDGWTDGRMDGRTDGGMDGWMHLCIHGCMHAWMCVCIHICKYVRRPYACCLPACLPVHHPLLNCLYMVTLCFVLVQLEASDCYYYAPFCGATSGDQNM